MFILIHLIILWMIKIKLRKMNDVKIKKTLSHLFQNKYISFSFNNFSKNYA